MNKIECGIAIIGGGGGGMFLASMLKGQGDVCIFSSTKIAESSTAWAKGGINAVLQNSPHLGDKWHYHAFDTIKSAKGLANVLLAEKMCRLAPNIINCLLKIGVDLEKNENNQPMQRMYGGQRLNYAKGNFAYRACYSKDKTGKAIAHALKNFIENKNEKSSANSNSNPNIYNSMHLVDIKYKINKTTEGREVSSVIFCNIEKNAVYEVFANCFVFASGGYSGVYEASTCSSGSLGYVPIALLTRAGAVFKDAEFVQFHPTGLYKFSTLISEACRAEGGYLENSKGERFMQKYDSHNMELAPRDAISKAIFNEMKLSGENFVYLNLTHIDKNIIKNKLENACKNAMLFCNIDITNTKLKICPVAHYSMGGVAVNENYQIINFSNAFAIGELACGSVHGANRLGCNSLLELFYSALMCLKQIKKFNGGQNFSNGGKAKSSTFAFSSAKNVDGLIKHLKNKANTNLAIEKCEGNINQMLFEIKTAFGEFERSPSIVNQPSVIEICKCVEFFSLAFVLQAMCHASLARKESRGSFYRSDFLQTNPAFAKNSHITYNLNNDNFTVKFEEANKQAYNQQLKNKLIEHNFFVAN